MDVVGVGTAKQIVNGHDTLLVFKDEIHLRSTRGDVDWYKTDGTLYASNTDEIYPDDGGYYTDLAGAQSSPIYAFLYAEPEDLSFTVTPDCDATYMKLTGTVPFVFDSSYQGCR